MKTQVFVLVPYDVPPAAISAFKQRLLEKHRFHPDQPGSRGRYDYLIGALQQSFDDPVAEGQLPHNLRRAYAGNICERANLPPGMVPAALVTPDGEWHDLSDSGWRMMNQPSDENHAALARWEKRYRQLVAEHQDCWVVEVWAHS